MSDANGLGYLYTVGAYATLALAGYGVYHVSTQKSRRRAAATQPRATRHVQPEPKKEDKKKKQRVANYAAESQESTAKAAKARVDAPETSTFLSNAQDVVDTAREDKDNREFAKQLSKAKQGTQFAARSESGKAKEKSVKQSRANKIAVPEENKPTPPSAPSSTGADADDDLSSAQSPVSQSADASGVADMLEPVPSGPSVIRLTGTEEKQQNKKAPKAFEQAESKKQRQNRKKAEAAKAAREAAESERKALEEKQRRAARIAEGRAAKDGSQFMATNGSKKSAWTQGATNGAGNDTNGTNGLLDTFDASTRAAAPAPVAAPVAQPSTSNTKQAKSTWATSLPSEEEQLEMLKEETDEWSTVKTKSSKKSGKKESPVDSGDDKAISRPAVQAKPVVPTPSIGNNAKANKSFGSFSALTNKDDAAEDAEEEWDV